MYKYMSVQQQQCKIYVQLSIFFRSQFLIWDQHETILWRLLIILFWCNSFFIHCKRWWIANSCICAFKFINFYYFLFLKGLGIDLIRTMKHNRLILHNLLYLDYLPGSAAGFSTPGQSSRLSASQAHVPCNAPFDLFFSDSLSFRFSGLSFLL